MKKKFKIIFTILLCALLIIFATGIVNADVGDFQRYDDYDYDYDYDSDYSSGGSGGDLLMLIWLFSEHPIIGLIVIASIILVGYKNRGKYKNRVHTRRPVYRSEASVINNTEVVSAEIKEIDPMFSGEKFLSWARDVFVRLQRAWTKREWKEIRPFESNELYEQHLHQLQNYIDTNRINVIDRIAVNQAELYDFKVDGDKEILKITLKATMKDYIIDAETKKVLEGDMNTDRVMTYRMTFARKAGVKTKEGTSNKSTTSCPNCGAPTNVTTAGECEYCHSIVTTGEHDWVLTNLESI